MKDENLRFMIGCGSIDMHDGGSDAAGLYRALKSKYLAPEKWCVKAASIRSNWDEIPRRTKPDVPPLIKGYLNAVRVVLWRAMCR